MVSRTTELETWDWKVFINTMCVVNNIEVIFLRCEFH